MRTSKRTSFEKVRGVSDVRIEADVAHLVVTLPPERRTPDKHLALYKDLGAEGIALRLVKMHPTGISFSVERENLGKTRAILDALGFEYEPADEMVILAICAVNMREMWGVMATMAETLLENNVEIVQVGDSHDAVLCMVPKSQVDAALTGLRQAFKVEGEAAA